MSEQAHQAMQLEEFDLDGSLSQPSWIARHDALPVDGERRIDLEINLVMASKDNAGIFSICSSGCGINIDDRSVIAIRLALSRSGTSLLYVCIHACRRQDQGNSHKLIDSWLD